MWGVGVQVISRPMFGGFGKAGSGNSIAFVSNAGKERGIKERYGLEKRVEGVRDVRRQIGRAHV